LGEQNLYAYTLSNGAWSVASLFSYTANGVAPVVGDPVGYVRNVSGNRNGAVFLDASRNLKTITQETAGGGWGFETSPNHDLASVLISNGAWKRYVP
jgi:hypothetical protein